MASVIFNIKMTFLHFFAKNVFTIPRSRMCKLFYFTWTCFCTLTTVLIFLYIYSHQSRETWGGLYLVSFEKHEMSWKWVHIIYYNSYSRQSRSWAYSSKSLVKAVPFKLPEYCYCFRNFLTWMKDILKETWLLLRWVCQRLPFSQKSFCISCISPHQPVLSVPLVQHTWSQEKMKPGFLKSGTLA